MDQLYLKRLQVLTVEKKTLTIVLLFLGEWTPQTRTKLQHVLKITLACCKIQTFFKNQRNLSNVFCFKFRLPYDLLPCLFFIYQSFLSQTLTTHRTTGRGREGKGRDHLLFHYTTSTRSQTFRHLVATLFVRWLSHIFNRTACAVYKFQCGRCNAS